MKPYKSIFSESGGSLEVSIYQHEKAKQIVDISNLEWGKTFKSDWYTAQSKCPPGWRMPTIQELYTARFQRNITFQSYGYWSSTSTQFSNHAWCIGMLNGNLSNESKDLDLRVCYVREV